MTLTACESGRDSVSPCKFQPDISQGPVLVQIQALKLHVSHLAKRQYDSSQAPPQVFFFPKTSHSAKNRICFSFSRGLPEDSKGNHNRCMCLLPI